jgi:insulysin
MNTNLVTFVIYFEIFTKLIAKEISDFNYFGAISENQFSISCSISSVYIKALGYTDSLERYITEYFKIISKLINIEKIENVINKLHKIIDEGINSANNFYIGSVSKQTKTMSEFIIKKLKVMNKKEVYENFRKELDQNKIPQEFLYFIKNFMKKVKYEWLVEGNILYNEAEKIIKKIETELNYLFGGINSEINNQHKEPLSINEIRKQKQVNFPSDKIYRYNLSSKDPKNESSTMLVYFQIDDFCFNKKDIFNQQLYEKYIKYFVLNYMMLYIYNETFYDVLRTEQQIGYDVSFSTATYNDVFGLQFYVCSSKYNPDEILERINKFIVDYDINKEQNLTDEKFENYKKALLVDFIEKPLTLDQEASRDLSFIFDRTYKFNQRDDLIKYTNEQLTKKEIIEYFNEYIFKKAKRLEVALYSSVKKEEKENEIKMDIEENSLPKKEDLKKEDVMEKENNNINKKENYVLPSYQNKEKIIIKDINDFHRQCVYYDTDYY